MSSSPFGFIRRSFSLFWRTVDGARRTFFNLIFLFIVVVLVIGVVTSGPKKLEDKTALLLDLKGQLVEQNSGSVRDTVLAEAKGDGKKTIQLRDVLQVLDAAAKDPKITSAVLLLDDLQGAGLPMLREIAAAVGRFKAAGKPVVAWGSSYDQRQYFLAAHASEVYLHPMGTILLNGYGRYRNYYRDALDKLGITVNLMKVGTYKSFAEPYIANAPSPAATEAESFLYNAMWATYTDGVEKARKLPAGSIMRGINDLPAQLAAVGGDVAKLALAAKLVDGLKTRDELRQLMITRGTRDEQTKSFRQVSFDDYQSRIKPKLLGDAVGVVIAEGDISDGNAPPGSIGGLSTANLVRKAREDDQIKAIVLRVNSPGGSAFGSELIRRELELTRAAGKPVVVSMGNVAASGGYWISMAADEVIADAATITGSIGVFAILPTADKAIDKLGVHTGGTTTTWLGDAFNPLRPLDPRFAAVIQSGINNIYADFTGKAAKARKTTPQKIDEVAQGRVWTGQQAKERGLVDTVGSYGDALKSAAARAKLGSDYRISYIEREPGKLDRVLNLFGGTVSQVLADQFKLALVPTGIPPDAAREMASELSWLTDLTNGRKNYLALTHCLCREP
ncbi:MAG: signal peptide peptidase SppA [Pseudomonadota bacterium]